MATTLVPVEEYLNTSFPDADCEYLDGQLVETTVGDSFQSSLQALIAHFLLGHYGKLLWVGTAARIRVTPTRYRIPDVVVLKGARPKDRVITEVPYIAIEIISPSDLVGELDDKIHEYLELGIPNVWSLNPRTRRAFVHTADASREVKDGVLRTQDGAIEIPLAEIFVD